MATLESGGPGSSSEVAQGFDGRATETVGVTGFRTNVAEIPTLGPVLSHISASMC